LESPFMAKRRHTRRPPPAGAARPRSAQPTPGDIPRLFSEALKPHQAGRLGEAEPLYRAVLDREDRHVDALTNLGTLRLQTGEFVEAGRLMDRALALNPRQIHALGNRGIALQA